MMSNDLEQLAQEARIHALTMIYHAGSGHPGGALSTIEILVQLYFDHMNTAPERVADAGRDRLVLSKGHACPALYAVGHLAGFLPRSELAGFRKLGRALQGHTHVGTTPFVEASTGSLGQGFSVSLGHALGQRHQGIDASAFAVLGDGEIQEGEVWEAAMFAAHHKLANLCVFLDYNKMQSDDTNANIMGLEPLADKWRAFGWHVLECDGHDFAQLRQALHAFEAEQTRPTIVIAHTIKGRGVSYMEGIPTWHGSVKMTDENLTTALTELGIADTAPYLDGSLYEVGS